MEWAKTIFLLLQKNHVQLLSSIWNLLVIKNIYLNLKKNLNMLCFEIVNNNHILIITPFVNQL
jgi:hypothetical protein